MRAIVIALFFLLITGCSSSKEAPTSIDEPLADPFVGTWALENSNQAIHFLSTGSITIEPGDLLAAINRFQNTQRNRYTSHLLNTGRYEILSDKELILYVTADWTGKGRGARRPAYKRVESAIVFEFEAINDTTLTLYKKNLMQGTEENLNSDENLNLTLLFIE